MPPESNDIFFGRIVAESAKKFGREKEKIFKKSGNTGSRTKRKIKINRKREKKLKGEEKIF